MNTNLGTKVGPTYNDVTNYIARRFVRIKILYWLLRLLDIYRLQRIICSVILEPWRLGHAYIIPLLLCIARCIDRTVQPACDAP